MFNVLAVILTCSRIYGDKGNHFSSDFHVYLINAAAYIFIMMRPNAVILPQAFFKRVFHASSGAKEGLSSAGWDAASVADGSAVVCIASPPFSLLQPVISTSSSTSSIIFRLTFLYLLGKILLYKYPCGFRFFS